ncbi:MAG: DUF2071 domain-containing protein [Planctomycetaceae bacterium]
MQLPVIRGIIDRRLLINYRVDPDILATILPAPFRPQLVNGLGIAGICLIRFRSLRPVWWPSRGGFSSENAAHRIAVQWDANGTRNTGVFVVRRQTNSRWNALAGGRLFPGAHTLAKFCVSETARTFHIGSLSDDGQTSVDVSAHITAGWPRDSVFASVDDASRFFSRGSCGYSPSRNGRQFEGLELHCPDWRVEPLEVEYARSQLFQNVGLFPPGSVHLDCGLLMRNIAHEWHALPTLNRAAAITDLLQVPWMSRPRPRAPRPAITWQAGDRQTAWFGRGSL